MCGNAALCTIGVVDENRQDAAKANLIKREDMKWNVMYETFSFYYQMSVT